MAKNYLIIGIANENDLVTGSTTDELDSDDQDRAREIIEAHMGCAVDRILIVDSAFGEDAPAQVINDFNTD